MRYARLALLTLCLIPSPAAYQDEEAGLPYNKTGVPFQSQFNCKADPLPAASPGPVKFLAKPKALTRLATLNRSVTAARGGLDTQEFALRFDEFGSVTEGPHAGAQLLVAKFYYSHSYERNRSPRRGVNYKRYLREKERLIELPAMSEAPEDAQVYQSLLKKLNLVEAAPDPSFRIALLEKPVAHIAAANLCFTFWEQLPVERGTVGQVIGSNAFYGQIYFAKGDSATVNYVHAALPDGTVLSYYLLPPPELDNPPSLGKGPFSCRSQYSNKSDESGPAADVVFLGDKPYEEIRVLRDLPGLGKVYVPRDPEKVPYSEYKMSRESYRKQSAPRAIAPLLTAAEYAARIPDFYWQDPLGRWVHFTNTSIRFPMAAEPLLYLYPTTEQAITVRLDSRVRIAAAEPALTDRAWQVVARPDGLLSIGSIRRGSLFWEGTSLPLAPPDSGFVVRRDGLSDFFSATLPRLGLNEEESGEFARYWLNRMQSHEYYLISFLDRQTIDAFAPIEITPPPDVFIRVLMDFVAMDAPVEMPAPLLPPAPARRGFVAMEWGGMQR